MEQTRRARLTGLAAALLTVAAILWTLFSSLSIGAVADGSYASAAEALALRYAEESIPTGQRVEDFAYTDAAYSTLVLSSRTSVGAAVALVRLATHPFGLGFSTRYLAVVYALLMGWGVYLLANGLARRSRTAAIVAAAGLPVLLANPAIIGYLNSLYPVGAAMAYFVLFLGAAVYCLCREKGCGVQWALLTLFAAQLMLRTMAQMMALLPAAVVAVVLCAVHSCPGKAERPLHAACVLIAVFMCVSGLVTGWQVDDTVHSAAANYLAVFQGYLPASENPEDTLESLGLPESYLADIGKSYYDASDAFVNDPHDAENAALLSNTISLGKRMAFAVQHPEIIRAMMDKNASALQNADSWYLADDAGNAVSSRSPLHTILETIFGRGADAIFRWCLICAALLVLLLPVVRRQGASVMLCAFLLTVLLGAVGYLPLAFMLAGGIDLLTVKPLAFLLGGFAVLMSFVSGAVLVRRLMAWLSVKEAKLALPPCTAGTSGGLLTYLRRIRVTQTGTVAIVAVVCIVLCCWQLLPAAHIGGVNNGDFGRMMEQIDLYWAQPQLTDESTQLEWSVVEDYAYREPFHPERLTSADPTYSLMFPSMLVRFITLLTGGNYSTQVQAFILLALVIAALLLLVHDLYPLLGKLTLPAGLLVACMLLGENYLAWYNSLFGETMIPVGLMMTIACTVHLALMPRGSRKSWLCMILLAVSARFLCTAKAQMALALPAALLLLIVFTVYHHPKTVKQIVAFSLMGALLCGLVSYDTLGVYRKNEGVSAKQTVWQSVFYGALMISDDPDAALAELGLPAEMKADIGKHAYYPNSEYVYPIESDELQEKFYDHVTTMTLVRYYLRHPKDLLTMMNRAAQESVSLSASFMTYTGALYSDNHPLYRMNLWRNLRSIFAARAFWEYVLVYGAAGVFCLTRICRKKTRRQTKLLAMLFLCVMFIGVMQYPLSVIGNGFADNNKQMYTFMLCHDLIVVAAGLVLVRRLIPARRTAENAIGEEADHEPQEKSA